MNFLVNLLCLFSGICATQALIVLSEQAGWRLKWFHSAALAVIMALIFVLLKVGVLSYLSTAQ